MAFRGLLAVAFYSESFNDFDHIWLTECVY